MGNLNSQRDWGHAKDYVEAMYLILLQDESEDFVIATGVTTSIREFVKMAFGQVGISLSFEGEGETEIAKVASCENKEFQLPIGQTVIKVDPKYFRPTEVDLLLGDPTKSNEKLGWKPKYDLQSLVKEMMYADVELFRRNQFSKNLLTRFSVSRVKFSNLYPCYIW